MLGVMWVLAILAASDNSQYLSILLSLVVLIHAVFCLIGYCIINQRVRENLKRTFLVCIGRKVPLLDSSMAASSSSQNVQTNPRAAGSFLAGSSFDTSRRNIGISASSTTSRSTAKTSSSPYRSDGQLRHTSTSTSNYNSDGPSFAARTATAYDNQRKRTEDKPTKNRKDSDSGSETDGRSLDLASSHSSDDDESRVGRRSNNTHRSTGVTSTPSYLPNITEHVQATTPPELNVVQSPQLFPRLQPVYAPRWSSQLPEAYLPNANGNY